MGERCGREFIEIIGKDSKHDKMRIILRTVFEENYKNGKFPDPKAGMIVGIPGEEECLKSKIKEAIEFTS